ncbi:hypothetical protein Cabys_1944 [Caldithrix abyssi DSM 13497]|uniref:Uncharacterized protein n=1 Tax=Caldithrix abyssi DSM 13497 TaxID=880073 RepID=A0A1J1C7M7_CALAY|nr:hypothetical protein Cabys_1944 [Caldithrix abyssi DSM 13497]
MGLQDFHDFSSNEKFHVQFNGKIFKRKKHIPVHNTKLTTGLSFRIVPWQLLCA